MEHPPSAKSFSEIAAESIKNLERQGVRFEPAEPMAIPVVKNLDRFETTTIKNTVTEFCESAEHWLRLPFIHDSFPPSADGDEARQRWKYKVTAQIKSKYGEEMGGKFYYTVLEENKFKVNPLVGVQFTLAALSNYLARTQGELKERLLPIVNQYREQIRQNFKDYQSLSREEKRERMKKIEQLVLGVMQELKRFSEKID